MIASYHTHTSRCGHAGDYADEEFVEAAIAAGFKVIGISDHTPWPYKSDYRSRMRMDITELEGYIESVLSMRERYADKIEVKLGLEAEYFPVYMEWLADLRPRLDYLILGNHFDTSDEQGGIYYGSATTAEHLETYTDSAIAAMETGLYAFFAHPDVVFSKFQEFDQYCEEAAHAICEAAARTNVPLEYNLSGFEKRDNGEFQGLGYPVPPFWQIASLHPVKATIDLDVHHPRQFHQPERIAEARSYLEGLGLEIVGMD